MINIKYIIIFRYNIFHVNNIKYSFFYIYTSLDFSSLIIQQLTLNGPAGMI